MEAQHQAGHQGLDDLEDPVDDALALCRAQGASGPPQVVPVLVEAILG
jgi:hypothetical protein